MQCLFIILIIVKALTHMHFRQETARPYAFPQPYVLRCLLTTEQTLTRLNELIMNWPRTAKKNCKFFLSVHKREGTLHPPF